MMRVIGGSLRGKKIIQPLDKSTRPLKDLVRESIFNILKHSKNENVDLNNAKILDLFSGTGSFGIECISRGAKKVFFFENYKRSVEILNKNIEVLNLKKNSKIFNKDIYCINNNDLKGIEFEIIFLDPPFKDKNINLLIEKIRELKIVNKKTQIILHRNSKFKENFENILIVNREQVYGSSKIIFGKII